MKRKNLNRISALILAFAILLGLFPLGPVNAAEEDNNNTYYVDSIGGDDNNNGTDTSTAWKTLSKVNGTIFQPGDRILFKAGCSWEGQLWPKGSGLDGSPIVIDMYGTGSKPLINGGPIGGQEVEPSTPPPTPEIFNPMPNMIVNEGFEAGNADGWQFKGDTSVVTGQARTGDYATRVGVGDSAAEQVVTGLKPNTTYRLKVWTKVENEPGKEGAQICLGMKEYGNPEAGVRTSSLTYTPLSIEFTTGATNTSARIFLWFSGSNGCAYGDDFEVKEVVTIVDLTNPGLESSDKSGWVDSNGWNVIDTNQYAGSYCAQIPKNESAEMNVTGLVPNTYYRLTAWAKVDNASEAAFLGVKNYGGQETSKKTSSTSYARLNVDFLTGDNATSATIYMKRDNSGDGNAYGDDFELKLLPESLIPKDNPNNKVSNSGFETGVMSPWDLSTEWNVVNEYAHNGEFSAQINPNGAAVQTLTGLKKNKGYKLRAFVKVEDPADMAQLGVKDFGGSEVSSQTSSTTYKFISVDFTTGANSTTATIYLKNSSNGRFVFGDDFELSETGSETFKLRNQSYWEVNNLQLTNYSTAGIEFKRRAVYVEAADKGTISHIYLKNLDIHDVNGGDPNHKNLDYESGGIIMLVNDDFQAPNVPSKFDDVLVEGCTFKNVSKEGIFIRNNHRLRGGFTAENTPDAIGEWYPNTNVVIRNNSLDTIGGDGIVAAECQSPLIEYNVAKDCHNEHEFWCVAIWSINGDDAVIQNNEAYGTKTTDDGQGFDIDWNQRRTIMQYNYSHDNEGGFMLMCCWYGESFNDDSIVRYNISQNDMCRIFEIHGPVKNSKIYNNTIYVKSGIAPKIYNMDWWDSSDGRYPENTYNYNNIIYNLGNGGYNFTNSINTVFDNNCFYGKHPNSEPNDAHKITSDPMLIAPGTGGIGRNTVEGYNLQNYSPCINTGKTIPDNGGKDFFGNAAPYSGGKTDIGAIEYQGAKQPHPNNKVTNPGFESGDKNSWNSGEGCVALNNNQNEGEYCVQISPDNSVEQLVTGLEPNKTYRLEAWVKVDDAADVAYLGAKQFDSISEDDDKTATTSSAEYVQLGVDFTTGASDTSAIIYLWRNGAGTGNAYGDDFEVMEVAGGTTGPDKINVLTLNPGFESGDKTGWSADGTNEIVNSNQHSGTYCVKITPNNSIERLITGLKPNTDYTLKAWAKVENPSEVVYLGVKDYGYDEIAANTSSTSYIQLIVDFTTGPENTSAKIYLWRNGIGEGSAYGDDFELLSVAGPANAPIPLDTLPSANQIAWQDLELTAFSHFGINTFTGKEWGDGTEDPELFNPTDFDATQWVSTLQNAGLKMLILTAKHHDGFCLWPSAYTEHSVKNSPWRDGQGDVVKEVADACHAAGMKFGIYLSPWDRHDPSYGPGGDDYNAYYMNQLTELLTNYGEISEVWMDGANDNTKPQDYNIYEWADLVHELQPKAVIFQGNFDIRWAGNENGVADEPCWSTVDENRMPVPGGIRWMPAECDVPIRPGWFYHEAEDNQVKSLSQLAYIYKNSVGLNANLLLSVSPDKKGLIPAADVTRLNEFKNYLEASYGNDLAHGAIATASVTREGDFAPENVVDNNAATYWAAPDGVNAASITLDLGSMKYFDMIELQEPIELGQRITNYNLEAWNGSEWVPLATKQSIGHKAIVQFEPVTASKVRLNITGALACPAIRTMKVLLEYEVRCKALGGTVTASTENPPNEPKENAFDDSTSTKWLTLASTGWIQYDFKDEKAYAINRYTITSANDVPARDPKDWILKGSNNGIAWDVLDTQTGVTFDNRFQTLSFNITNTTEYKIYKLEITANHGDGNMQLAEIELYGGAGDPVQAVDICTGGIATASSENVNPEWGQNHNAGNAFDDQLGWTKWMSLTSAAAIQYDFAGDAAYAVNGYTITSTAEDEPTRDPKNWTLEGSNDGSIWNVVDTRTGETFDGRLLKKIYSCNNTTAYKMYRLNITANNGSDYIQIAEIEMFGNSGAIPQAKKKVALIGDSITDMGIYPSELQKLLGTDYIVRNYGESGHTMLKSGDYPYWNTQDYIDSTNWLPDIVVIMLGTNDSKGYNWEDGTNANEFYENYKEMINHYKNLSSHPRVYVNTCPTAYTTLVGDISDQIISGQIIPLILQAVDETDTSVIDVHSSTAGMPENFPDKVHPNTAGSRVIAASVCTGITGSIAPTLPVDLCLEGTASANDGTVNQDANKAFDDNIFYSKWMVIGNTGWIQYDFSDEMAHTVNGYALTSSDDEAGRDPKDWTLKGSNDGSEWITVDTRTNETFSDRNQTKVFTLNNSTEYKMYRLDISANNGSSELQIAELELFELSVPDITPGEFSLTSPANGAINQPLATTLTWEPATNADAYNIVVSANNDFSSVVASATLENNTYQLSGLAYGTVYYWKVTAINGIESKEAINNGISFKTISYSQPGDTYVPPVTKSPVSTDGTVKIIPKLDKNSNEAKAELNSLDYAKALQTVQPDKDGVKTIVLEIGEMDKVSGYVQQIPTESVTDQKLKSKIVIKTELSDITIPSNMLNNFENISTRKVEISVKKADITGLNEETRNAVGNRPVIDINLSIDGKDIAWSNINTWVEVAIPYTPTAKELKEAELIVVWYLSDTNKVIPITNGRYDAARGVVVFTTNHFSPYAVSYVNKSFNDIDSHQWAKKSIEVMASKGIISGTSATTFNPDKDITRADFMVLLINALGLTAEFDTNFKDVDESKYYYNAIGVAKRLGIINGVSKNNFDPTAKISRQDMMVVTAKALKLAGKLTDMSKHADLNGYTDESEIAKYAIDSVSILMGEGIMHDDNSFIRPLHYVTRAEVAVMIYNVYNKK